VPIIIHTHKLPITISSTATWVKMTMVGGLPWADPRACCCCPRPIATRPPYRAHPGPPELERNLPRKLYRRTTRIT